MQALAARKARVHVRGGVVEAAPCSRCQSNGQLPDCRLVGEGHRSPHQATTAVEPHLVGRVDQDVGDLRVTQEGVQGAQARPTRPPGRG